MNLHSLNVLIGSMAILVLLSGSAARSAEQIRVGYVSLSTSYAPIWVAGEAQLFQKNGITAEVLYLESALVRTALIAGDIVMGGMSGPPWLRRACKAPIRSSSRAFSIRCNTGSWFG